MSTIISPWDLFGINIQLIQQLVDLTFLGSTIWRLPRWASLQSWHGRRRVVERCGHTENKLFDVCFLCMKIRGYCSALDPQRCFLCLTIAHSENMKRPITPFTIDSPYQWQFWGDFYVLTHTTSGDPTYFSLWNMARGDEFSLLKTYVVCFSGGNINIATSWIDPKVNQRRLSWVDFVEVRHIQKCDPFITIHCIAGKHPKPETMIWFLPVKSCKIMNSPFGVSKKHVILHAPSFSHHFPVNQSSDIPLISPLLNCLAPQRCRKGPPAERKVRCTSCRATNVEDVPMDLQCFSQGEND